MDALKFQSDNSNICVTSALVSINIFLIQVEIFLILCISEFLLKLDILDTMRC